MPVTFASRLVKPPFGTLVNPAHTLAQGLVLSCLFNEGNGTKVFNAAPYPIVGTLEANVTWVSAYIGRGPVLDFPGGSTANLRVVFDREDLFDFEYTGDWTISCWLRPDNLASLLEIVWAKQEQVAPYIGQAFCNNLSSAGLNDNGKVDLQQINTNPTNQRENASTNDTLLNDGNWHLYTTVSRLGVITIYEDGKALAMTVGGAGLSATILNNHAFALGDRYPTASTVGYNGKMDDVRVWNRALDTQEILSLFVDPYAMFAPRQLFVSAAAAGIARLVGGSLVRPIGRGLVK